MEWIQVAIIAGSTVGTCWWTHKQHTSDMKEFHNETKDFHGRLCVLEERYIQMMQRILEKKGKE